MDIQANERKAMGWPYNINKTNTMFKRTNTKRRKIY